MPDQWHALIWAGDPLTISQVMHEVKKVSARKLHAAHETTEPGVAASILEPAGAERG